MQVWNVLTDEETVNNAHVINAEYVQKGTAIHPITFRPYAYMQNKWEKNQVYLVPLSVEVAEDKPMDYMAKEGNL